jgi:hypothetical protein
LAREVSPCKEAKEDPIESGQSVESQILKQE